MMKPEVTVGIAFRNPGREFVLALKSVFAQLFVDWELILCNDGSTDGALDFAQSIDDPRLRVISDGHSRGLAVRLNQMISVARGEFFFRMDADDAMHPDRIYKQLPLLARGSDAVVGTSAYSMDNNDVPVGLKAAVLRQSQGFAARHDFFHTTVAATVGWFQRNPYNEQHIYHRSEDAELWCRTTSNSRFMWISEPLMFIRELGVFSYTKHLCTTLGVLHLLREHSRGQTDCVCLLTRELGKLWITSVLDALGSVDWLVRKRGCQLSVRDLQQATATLARIKAQQLPTRQEFEPRTLSALAGVRG
jgi:glycosyltransferase involved in cell wall biosynthesis